MENSKAITKAAQSAAVQPASPAKKEAQKSIGAMMSAMLDSENYRKRFDELLGKRAPQFISSLVTLVNSDGALKQAFAEAPITIIQAALKAATYDLPIDPALGYAYIVPFKNTKTIRGERVTVTEAAFIMGYKGMIQLALRTGVYKTINVIDVREGELVRFNRLTEEIELEFITPETERVKKPIIGWCGYYKLVNGTEKTIYKTIEQIKEHERAHRKGEYMGKGWRENFDAMCAKTVLRELIGKWGLMSIDYQRADAGAIAAAEAISRGALDDGDGDIKPDYVVTDDGKVVNAETGTVVAGGSDGETEA